jgi:anti-anti-sigma factor
MLISSQTQRVPTPLRIDSVEREGALVLVVEGELDLATSHLLDEALVTARGTDAARIVVDLRGVRFMDSSGLQVLVRHIGAEESGPRIRLTQGSPQVQRVFELTGLLESLPFDAA